MINTRTLIGLIVLAALAAPGAVKASAIHTAPGQIEVVRLEVVPPRVVLRGLGAQQRLLVTGYRLDGSVVDLSESALFAPSPHSPFRMSGTVLLPLRDGHGAIVARVGRLSVSADVTVSGATAPVRWTFENHVESVFSRQGCNTGPCHGAGSGKGGLKLSLRGFDPAADFLRLTTEGRGRRVVRVNPADSLLLKKPSLQVAHVGGLRLRRDSLEYRIVSEWIAQGAVGPSSTTPRLVSLSITPSDRTLLPNASQQLLVTARFSDGRSEDVTHWSRFSSAEDPIAKVDDAGKVSMRGRGETAISAWFLGRVASASVRVPFNIVRYDSRSLKASSPGKPGKRGGNPHTSLAPEDLASSARHIDKLVDAKLAALGLTPSPLCADSEFIRRASLDSIGTLPTAEETRAFLSDSSPDKRRKLIDALLGKPQFVDFWTYRWGDLLRVNRDLIGAKGMASLQAWLRDSVAKNRGWDQIAFELLTSSGPSDSCGPANFYRMATKPEELAENVSQVFLGIRVQCAHCHNHPFEKWTQADYYRMASVFARMSRKETDGIDTVFASSSGDVVHPRFGKPLPPAAFDGPAISLEATGDRRIFLARWITSANNPYFGRAIVNRVWKQFMGRGLVEPVDDMRLTNPPSNRELLDGVTESFVRAGFDLKLLMRSIMLSNAYQRSSAPTLMNRQDDRFYSHYLPRRLGAETLLDAISQVTGAPEKFDGVATGVRAISLPDTRIESPFLDAFGRPARQVTCECERNMEPNLAQALHLINAQTLNEKIQSKSGTLDRLLAIKSPDANIVRTLTLRSLSRPPTPSELATVLAAIKSAASGQNPEAAESTRKQVFSDFLWALLSSPEFTYNH